jgi:Cys-tRNA(Pro)/Cys-tRNA(Cys) deacylase
MAAGIGHKPPPSRPQATRKPTGSQPQRYLSSKIPLRLATGWLPVGYRLACGWLWAGLGGSLDKRWEARPRATIRPTVGDFQFAPQLHDSLRWIRAHLNERYEQHLVTARGDTRPPCRLYAAQRLRHLKTNATRQLDKLGAVYELRDYEVDLDDLGAVKVASQIGLPAAQVFKTLCAKADDGTIVFAVVPGDRELDLKALARLAAKRGMELVPDAQLRQLTGYIRGGVTALAAKRDYAVYNDDSALSHPVIAVSAEIRGTQILLAPKDYIQAAAATSGPIAR